MSSSYRLKEGGLVKRDQHLNFTFNGRSMYGVKGDTLASALLANGIQLVGRSFKYHRPRGIFSSGPEEPNALVQLETGSRTLPNQQATQIELYDGLFAESINCWPNPHFDFMSIIGWFHHLIPAGFYYKTFMWPSRTWHIYEYLIRRVAGLGKAPAHPDPDQYDKINAHCDVLVVGAGPAGLSAALSATRAGARVIVADAQNRSGGWLLNENQYINNAPAMDWVNSTEQELLESKDTRLLSSTTAFGYYDHNFIGLTQHLHNISNKDRLELPRQRIWRVRAKQVILCTGAIERPLLFANNDRPGVMLAGATRAYINRYGVAVGRKVCIFTNNDDAYRSALDLKHAGIDIPAIIDVRPEPAGDLVIEAIEAGIEVIDGAAVVRTNGKHAVKEVEIMDLDESGHTVIGTERKIPCDVIASSGGWNPAIHLHSHSGGKTHYDENRGIFLPTPGDRNCQSIGAANGSFALKNCLKEGFYAGKQAANATGAKKQSRKKVPKTQHKNEEPWQPKWIIPTKGSTSDWSKHFLDQAHDVTIADIQLAAREGYQSIEHTKRYTTLGMAPDQGKTGNIIGMAILSAELGINNPGQIGTSTFRPPYTPITIGALAGRNIGPLMDPVRMTPMHQWHTLAGCYWEDVGQWKRPWYYPKNSENLQEAVAREALAVRNSVGILDASTLGKIDIQGPDASKLLNLIYTNEWNSLPVGHCRYGVMLGEDGMIFDDGVTSRLAKNRYLMTTTSGNAARVLEWLEEWLQTEWPKFQVYCTSVTEHWANITICGPCARALLDELTDDIDLSPEAFPFMTWREGKVGGFPARVFRVSFTGEVSYEINIPASFGLSLWTSIINAGEKYGITPFGTEAMHVLRAEKGYIIVGQETDGTVTPNDLGMNWAISKKKDFIGKRSLSRSDTLSPNRKQLVGLLPKDRRKVLPEGGQITSQRYKTKSMPMIGHITSSYHSPNLGHSFALALLKKGRSRHGETVYIPLLDETVEATIESPVFYDPNGEKLHG